MKTTYGITTRIRRSARDPTLNSFPFPVQIPAGTTRVLNYVNEARVLARSVIIINQDGTNSISVQINNDSNNPFTIPASGSLPINDQWIEQIRVVAGALGRTDIIAEVCNISEAFGIGRES